MNDRFKFRAWDTYQKKMSLIPFAISQDGVLCSGNGMCYLETSLTDSFVFMQSTGLKDKNGKLIFEGDILMNGFCGAEAFEQNSQNTVEWNNKETGFYPLSFHTGNNVNSLEDTYFDPLQCEVIGNIYEPPEKPNS